MMNTTKIGVVAITALALALISMLVPNLQERVSAHDTGKRVTFFQGVASGGQTVFHFGWHSDAIGQALDLNFGTDPYADAGAGVSLDTEASQAVVWSHAYSTTFCQGVRIELFDNSDLGNYIGEARYLHVDPAAGVPGSGWTIQSGRTFTYLGTIASNEPLCPSQWDGPHLHQSVGNAHMSLTMRPFQARAFAKPGIVSQTTLGCMSCGSNTTTLSTVSRPLFRSAEIVPRTAGGGRADCRRSSEPARNVVVLISC